MFNNKSLKPLIIIDGFGFIFRAYYVQPPITSPSGAPVGAVYGFTSMLVKLISDFKPEHAVIVFDHPGKTFRHDLYKDYKANRTPMPTDLAVQLKSIEKAAEALKLTSADMKKLGIVDDIIKEPSNGAHRDHAGAIKKVKRAIKSYLAEFIERPQSGTNRRLSIF